MTTSDNYGQGTQHNFRREIETTLRPAMERETRIEMSQNPSHEAVDKEVSYRWGQETSAMGKLSNEELEVCFKSGLKPSEYLLSRDS